MHTPHLIIIIIMFVCACGSNIPRTSTIPTTSTINLTAISSEGQSLTYQDGKQVLVSRKTFSNAGIYPHSDFVAPDGIASFYVKIYNNHTESLNFSTENIKSYCGNRIIKVLTYDQSFTRLGNILFPPTQTSSNFSGMTPDDVYKSMALDIERERLRNEQFNRQFPMETRMQALKNAASTFLKRQTIPPKSDHGGIFEIQYPGGEDILNIEVITPYEIHKFTFKLQKR